MPVELLQLRFTYRVLRDLLASPTVLHCSPAFVTALIAEVNRLAAIDQGLVSPPTASTRPDDGNKT